MDEILRYTLRVNRQLFRKFRYIAESEGRSANKEIEQFMKRSVRDFEKWASCSPARASALAERFPARGVESL